MENNHCQKLLQSISDYIDGTRDPALCALLEEHLCGCENCQVVYNTTLKTIDLYHTVESHEELPGEVRERLFMRLNLEDYLKKPDVTISKSNHE